MKDEYDFSKGKRGPVVPLTPGKTRITIRTDDDILDWFRTLVDESGAGNCQTAINRALRENIEHEAVPMEDVFRRVLTEEMPVLTTRGQVAAA